MKSIAIIGGGIAGLSCVHELVKSNTQNTQNTGNTIITIYEATNTLGGFAHSENGKYGPVEHSWRG